MNYAPDNALRFLKNSQVSIIVRRHVAQMQRNSFTSWRFGTIGRPQSRYNRYKMTELAAINAMANTTLRSQIRSARTSQNCGLICPAHVCLTLSPSATDMVPIRAINKNCSRQSSLDNRTVDSLRSPEAFQSTSVTSTGERGLAEVTAATTTSSPSSQRIRTGRFFDPLAFVNGMFATQNSPGRIVIVQTFVLRRVTIQKCRVITNQVAGRVVIRRSDGNEPMTRTDYSSRIFRQTQCLARPQANVVNDFRKIRVHRDQARNML